ncbi:hypothetical protein ['Cynodon dactylon' phytoplasma]|uniref:hypothetical protein n=1 Tax='Cynodon dactylon' phytoplasma TaxID=295320 RepID=UPI001265C2BD|nr:hypothetical protein ['Cynodon dactylon' phytoplasma]KAB8121856.1 hypothetical protein F1741_01210 ['Cynodon dactylon' phytoplasma]
MFYLNNKKNQINISLIFINFLFLFFLNNNVFAVRKSITTYALYQNSRIIETISSVNPNLNPNTSMNLLVHLKADLTEELGIESFEEFKQKCSFFYLNRFNMYSILKNNQEQVIDSTVVRTPRINVIDLEQHTQNENILLHHIYPRTINIEDINNTSANELTIIIETKIKNEEYEESPSQNLILDLEIYADGYTDLDKKFFVDVNINPEVQLVLELSE